MTHQLTGKDRTSAFEGGLRRAAVPCASGVRSTSKCDARPTAR